MATKKAAHRTMRAKGKAKTRTHLIPAERRMAVVKKLHKAGKTSGAIAKALGWANGNGYGMVKKLMIAAKLRRK